MGAVGGTQYAGRKSRPQGQRVQPMYSYRTGICERLPAKRPERDHVLRIDRYALATVYLKQPGELHDRPASGIENHPLDVAGVSLDPIGSSTNDGYLCCRWHVPCAGAYDDERLKARRSGRVGSR